MAGFLKAHLVFTNMDNAILEEISKYCQVTAIHESIDDWAQDYSGVAPDLVLINCGSQATTFLEKKRTRDYLRQFSQIKESRTKSRLVLLFPEKFFKDTLIVELLRLELFNFWFIDSFDQSDIIDFIYTSRDLTDVEEYIKEKEKDMLSGEKTEGLGIKRFLNRIYQPYYVKSNIIAFFSDDDSQRNYGVAVLTALELARRGFKVSLVETIAKIPHLAGILSVPHPYYNIRHAVTIYAEGNKDFIRNCFYNKEIYLKDRNSPGKDVSIEDYPDGLFLLPDGIRKDNLCISEIQKYWHDFINELSKIIIFEKDFHFLIFICQGKDYFNDFIMEEIAYQKFITISMLPGSLVYGLNERKKGKGRVHLIGQKKISYISNQLADLDEDDIFYFPDNFSEEFLEFVYLKKKNRISQETSLFIKQIIQILGVKNEIKIDSEKGMLNGLRKIIKI